MKRFMRKAAAVLFAAVLLTGVYAPMASAETTKVIVHAQDGQAWGSMNVYNWGDNGETAGAWPGAEMTAEADGWYTYTFETECPLNLVFSAKGGSPQSSNIEGLAADAGEVWVVIGGEGEANDMGASTNTATLYTEPEEGWPVVAAAAEETATEDTTEAAATEETTETTETTVPKTGEDTTFAVTMFGLAAFSAVAVVVAKKKEAVSEN